MPQIRIITSEKEIIDSLAKNNIGEELIKTLENLWPITKGDVTFTLIEAKQTFNECDIQLEVHYSPNYVYFNNEFLNLCISSRKIDALKKLGETLKKYFSNDILASVIAHDEAIVIPYS